MAHSSLNKPLNLLTNALFPLFCISKFTAIKTNLNVIYVTEAYLHKKFIYNLFKLQSHFIVSHKKTATGCFTLYSLFTTLELLGARSFASHGVWFLWILIKRLGSAQLTISECVKLKLIFTSGCNKVAHSYCSVWAWCLLIKMNADYERRYEVYGLFIVVQLLMRNTLYCLSAYSKAHLYSNELQIRLAFR